MAKHRDPARNASIYLADPDARPRLQALADSAGMTFSAFCSHVLSTYAGFGDQAVYEQARRIGYVIARRLLTRVEAELPNTVEEAIDQGLLEVERGSW